MYAIEIEGGKSTNLGEKTVLTIGKMLFILFNHPSVRKKQVSIKLRTRKSGF